MLSLDVLVQITDVTMEEAVRRCGEHLACHRGCAVCCFGPFAITRLDAERLQRGWKSLTTPVAEAIRERARHAIESMRADFPGDAESGRLSLLAEDEEAFAARLADLPCPALSPESGACLLYEYRPIACRTYGPPLLLDGESLPPCPLCFKRATSEEIENARTRLDLIEIERQLPSEYAERTLIAYALRD